MNTKYMREHFNLTQKEFADIIGVSVRTVENWELRESCKPFIYDLIDFKLCSIFHEEYVPMSIND